VLTPDKILCVSDARYTTQLAEECPGLECFIRQPHQKLLDVTVKILEAMKLSAIGVEGDDLALSTYLALREKLEGIELPSLSGVVEDLRMIKDAEEIEETRQAVWMAERAFAIAKNSLRVGQTERDVSHLIENSIRQFGGQGCSFEPIVATGDRSALPHYRASTLPIGQDPVLLIDWGATARRYKSDLTRVLVTGKIPPKLERIYRVVLTAQQAAIRAIRPGVVAKDVDSVARKIIADAGFGKYFGHGLGHGLGMDIHEAPRLNATCEVKLAAGMIVTVEPGIYLPGVGGVRIEDDVLVTRTGHEVLTSVPKELDDQYVQLAP
jgi:Xaa-Pro aminopeptidase